MGNDSVDHGSASKVEALLPEWLTALQSAADQGESEAQMELGLAYADGAGVEQSDELSRKWLQRAAEQGSLRAQNYLAWLYSIRLGNDEQSFYWFFQAADQGDADAQFNVGVAYEEGVGVTQDSALAQAWYLKAASQDHEGAILRLDRMIPSSVR